MDESPPIGPDDRLFRSSRHNWQRNAALWSRRSKGWPYALGFRMAGDGLVERALANREQDLLLFPILFCYRHAVELAMKDVIYLDQRANRSGADAVTTHDLRKIWPRARTALESAGGGTDRAMLDAIERIIGELSDVDPGTGELFRYDRDRQGRGREFPEALMRVDVGNLYATMGKVLDYLEACIDWMDDMLQAMDFGAP